MKFVFIFVFLASTLGNKVLINDAIDKLLESGKIILKLKGQDKMKIKDLDKTFEQKLFGKVKVKGQFKATGGMFQDLTTLRRTGDVFMGTKDNNFTITASMGLSKLEVSFNKYSFKVLEVNSQGSLIASCADNAITATIRPTYTGNECRAHILSSKIDRMGKFNVTLKGNDPLNQVGTLLLNWILNTFNKNIREEVNKRLTSALTEALKSKNICSMIPKPL